MRKFVFIAMLLPAFANGAVYKCVDSEGRVTFSDRACAGAVGGVEVDVKPAAGAGSPRQAERSMSEERRRSNEYYEKAIERIGRPAKKAAPAARAGNSPCKEFSSTELRTMIIRNQVVVGMKISDALKSWGSPESINGTQYAYFWEKGHAFFYDRAGCVSTVQGSYVGGKFVR